MMADNENPKVDIRELLDELSKGRGVSPSFSDRSTGHSLEAEELRKAWYSYVFALLEKLTEKVNELYNDRLKDKTSCLKENVELKEKIREEIAQCKRELEKNIEKIELETKNSLTSKDSVSHSELNEAIANAKNDYSKELDPIKTLLTEIKVKVGIWGAIAGAVVSAIVMILSAYI
jgi:hypothetical protein